MSHEQNNIHEPQPKQSLAVPIAIVLAGALVAVGIFFSGKNTVAPSTGNQGPVKQASVDINLKPLSSADHIIGAQNAKVTLVEYSDLECPFCKSFHQTLQKLMTGYGDKIAWAYRHFPIAQLHPKAPKEAQAAECAADQGKFWEFTNKVFEVTPSNNGLDAAQLPVIAGQVGANVTTFNNCLASTAHTDDIAKSVNDAQAVGANGTPTSFIVMSSPISDKAIQDIQVMTAQFKLPDGSPLVFVSKDKKIIELIGALPYDAVKGVIDVVLGTK